MMRTAALLLFAAAPLLADTSPRNTKPAHPWAGCKPGSWVKYKYGNQGVDCTQTLTLVEVTKEKVTLNYLLEQNGGITSQGQQEIFLATENPYPSYEKGESGKERITVGAKTYACTWTVYTYRPKRGNATYTLKRWDCPTVVGGLVKMEGSSTGNVGGGNWSMELIQFLKK